MRITELQPTLQRLLKEHAQQPTELGRLSGVSGPYLQQVKSGRRTLATVHIDAVLAAMGLELQLTLVPLSPAPGDSDDAGDTGPRASGTAR